MMIERNFFKKFSSDVKELIDIIFDKGFYLTMVGGAVRDYYLTGKITSDIDFELRTYDLSRSPSCWKDDILNLGNYLRENKGYNVQFLPFSILRVILDDQTVEFASPRQEVFSFGKEAIGHRDFKAQLFPHLDYRRAFSRRDFSVNSIGIELVKSRRDGEYRFREIDPFGGKQDLHKRVLRAVGDTFFFDPVRFLRLIRFKIKLGFTVDPALESSLHRFDLTKLTAFYFFSEAVKEDFFTFSQSFFSHVRNFNLALPNCIEQLSFLESLENLPKSIGKIKSLEKVFIILTLLGKENLEEISQMAGLRRIFLKRVLRLVQLVDQIESFPVEDLFSIPVEEVLSSKEMDVLLSFDSVFDLVQEHTEIFEAFLPFARNSVFWTYYQLLSDRMTAAGQNLCFPKKGVPSYLIGKERLYRRVWAAYKRKGGASTTRSEIIY
jgi:hypothetical protein